MKFQEISNYPFSSDTVLRLFCDKDYFLAKFHNDGATNIELVEDIKNNGSSRITVRRDVDIDINIPAFAQRSQSQRCCARSTDQIHRSVDHPTGDVL